MENDQGFMGDILCICDSLLLFVGSLVLVAGILN